LQAVLTCIPTTADSTQFYLFCCQPEPFPRILTARVSQPTLRDPCRLLAWPGQIIHTAMQDVVCSTTLQELQFSECDRKNFPRVADVTCTLKPLIENTRTRSRVSAHEWTRKAREAHDTNTTARKTRKGPKATQAQRSHSHANTTAPSRPAAPKTKKGPKVAQTQRSHHSQRQPLAPTHHTRAVRHRENAATRRKARSTRRRAEAPRRGAAQRRQAEAEAPRRAAARGAASPHARECKLPHHLPTCPGTGAPNISLMSGS